MIIFTGDFNKDSGYKQDQLPESFMDVLGAREDWDNPEIYDILASCETDYQVQVGTEGLGEAIANFFAGLFQAIGRMLESLFGGGSGGGSSGGGSSSGSSTGFLNEKKHQTLIEKLDKLVENAPDTKIKLVGYAVELVDLSTIKKLQREVITYKEELYKISQDPKFINKDWIAKFAACKNFKELHQLQDTLLTIPDFNKLINDAVNKSPILEQFADKIFKINDKELTDLQKLFTFYSPNTEFGAKELKVYDQNLFDTDRDPALGAQDAKICSALEAFGKQYRQWGKELKKTRTAVIDDNEANDPQNFLDGEKINQFQDVNGNYLPTKAKKYLIKEIDNLRKEASHIGGTWMRKFGLVRRWDNILKVVITMSDDTVRDSVDNYFKNQKTGTECAITLYRALGGN